MTDNSIVHPSVLRGIMAQAKQNNRQNGKNGKPTGRRVAPSRRPRNQPSGRPMVMRTPNRIPRGLAPKHHFNAFGTSTPQALPFSIGPATRISGYRSITVTVESNEDYLLVFDASHGMGQLCRFSHNRDNNTWGANEVASITSTGFGLTPTSGSPEVAMCSRGSVRLRNISPAGNVAGLVRTLRLGTPTELQYTPSAANLTSVQQLIEGHSRTHTYSGSTLTETHQWDQIPVNQTDYMGFTNIGFQNSFWSSATQRGMSTVFMYISALGYQQTYEVSFAGDYYCRYGASGPLANIAQLPPTTTIAHTNYMRDVAESVGSAGINIIKDVGSFALNGAQSMASGYLKNLINSSYSARAPQLMSGIGAQRGMLALEEGALALV